MGSSQTKEREGNLPAKREGLFSYRNSLPILLGRLLNVTPEGGRAYVRGRPGRGGGSSS